MDYKRLCIILFLLALTLCANSKKKGSKIKGRAEDQKKASEAIKGMGENAELDRESLAKAIASLQDAGELDDEEVATFYHIMDKMKGNLEMFTSKHEEVDSLKIKFQTELKGLEKLHSEMRATQNKMALEQEALDQQQSYFHQLKTDLEACQDDFENFEAEKKGWEKEILRYVKDLKSAENAVQDEKKISKTCEKKLTAFKAANSKLTEEIKSTGGQSCEGHPEMEKEKKLLIETHERERQKLVDTVVHLQAELDKGGEAMDEDRDAVIKRKDERIAFFQEEKLRLVDNHKKTEETYVKKLKEVEKQFEEVSRTGPSAEYITKLQEEVKELNGKVSFCKAESAHVTEQYAEVKLMNENIVKSVNHWNLKYVNCVRNNTKLEKDTSDIQTKNQKLSEKLNADSAELSKLRADHENSISIRDRAKDRVVEIDRQCKKDIKALNVDLKQCQIELSEAALHPKPDEDGNDKCQEELEENNKTWKGKMKTMERKMESMELKQKRGDSLYEQTRENLKQQSAENSICQIKLGTATKGLATRDDSIKSLSKTCVKLGQCEFDLKDLQDLHAKALLGCHCIPIEEMDEDGETVITGYKIEEGHSGESVEEILKADNGETAEGGLKAKLSEQYKLVDELRATSNENMQKYLGSTLKIETLEMMQKTVTEQKVKCQQELQQLESKMKGGQSTCDNDGTRQPADVDRMIEEAKEDAINCQETLSMVRSKQKTCTETLETVQTGQSELMEECEELYEDYKKCDSSNKQLDMKARSVDLIVQKMEGDHQNKLTLLEKKLQDAGKSENEMFWIMLVFIILCLVFGYYSCYSYFRHKYSKSNDIDIKKKSKDTKKRR